MEFRKIKGKSEAEKQFLLFQDEEAQFQVPTVRQPCSGTRERNNGVSLAKLNEYIHSAKADMADSTAKLVTQSQMQDIHVRAVGLWYGCRGWHLQFSISFLGPVRVTGREVKAVL